MLCFSVVLCFFRLFVCLFPDWRKDEWLLCCKGPVFLVPLPLVLDTVYIFGMCVNSFDSLFNITALLSSGWNLFGPSQVPFKSLNYPHIIFSLLSRIHWTSLHRSAVKSGAAETKWGTDFSDKDHGTFPLFVGQYWWYCDLPALINLQSMSFTLHWYWFFTKLLRSSDNSFMEF